MITKQWLEIVFSNFNRKSVEKHTYSTITQSC